MPAIRNFDIGLIGYKGLNIRSVCVMFYLGNFANSPTHKSMKKAVLLQGQSFLLPYCSICAIIATDKRIAFLFLAEFSPLSGTHGRGTGALFFFI